MHKNIKLTLAVLCLLSVVVLSGCKKDENDNPNIVATWKEINTQTNEETFFSFFADNTYHNWIVTTDGDIRKCSSSILGTYTYDKNEITITNSLQTITLDIESITDKELVWDWGEYMRVGDANKDNSLIVGEWEEQTSYGATWTHIFNADGTCQDPADKNYILDVTGMALFTKLPEVNWWSANVINSLTDSTIVFGDGVVYTRKSK